MLGVLLIDAIGIGIYLVAGVARWHGGARLGFALAWTLATLALVTSGLVRLRRARARPSMPPSR